MKSNTIQHTKEDAVYIIQLLNSFCYPLIKMTDELRQKYSEMIFYLDWFECI